jgi:hypothetical protein
VVTDPQPGCDSTKKMVRWEEEERGGKEKIRRRRRKERERERVRAAPAKQ